MKWEGGKWVDFAIIRYTLRNVLQTLKDLFLPSLCDFGHLLSCLPCSQPFAQLRSDWPIRHKSGLRPATTTRPATDRHMRGRI